MAKMKIKWTNTKNYDRETINYLVKFVKKNINGFLPLYGEEVVRLAFFSKKQKIPFNVLFHLRQTLMVQKEIYGSSAFYNNQEKIEKDMEHLADRVNYNNLHGYERENKYEIKKYFGQHPVPVIPLIKMMRKIKKFNVLAENFYVKKLYDIFVDSNNAARIHSIEFETTLENYLKNNCGLSFRTEYDIRRDGDYSLTPDILFDKPIIIELDGSNYSIRWIDAKNYTLINVPFIVTSLKKQATKYYDVFGFGAFVFHYGFDSSVVIPNVLLLDGSFMDNIVSAKRKS